MSTPTISGTIRTTPQRFEEAKKYGVMGTGWGRKEKFHAWQWGKKTGDTNEISEKASEPAQWLAKSEEILRPVASLGKSLRCTVKKGIHEVVNHCMQALSRKKEGMEGLVRCWTPKMTYAPIKGPPPKKVDLLGVIFWGTNNVPTFSRRKKTVNKRNQKLFTF